MTDETLSVQPEIPSVVPTPGWSTSQGQMTATFTLICMGLSFAGIVYTPEQHNDWVDRIEHIATVILPLLGVIPVLMSYITSRGKIASNALNANAAIKVAALTPSTPAALKGIPGLDFKKPETYEALLNIAAQLGVPGAAQANAIDQQIHPADLITNILGMFHKKHKDNNQ